MQAENPSSPDITLYSFYSSSSSFRVRIALHHKQIPFNYISINIHEGKQKTPEFAEINPACEIPVLEVQSLNKTRLSQSLAIIEYLEEAYPTKNLLPKDLVKRAQARSIAQLIGSIHTQQSSKLSSKFLAEEDQVGNDAKKKQWGRVC